MNRIFVWVVMSFSLVSLGRTMDDAEKYLSTEMNRTVESAAIEQSGELRILVLGNSIALHGVAPAIGWTNRWGMAASASEKDFAHLVWRGIERECGVVADCRIRNVYEMEKRFSTGYDPAVEMRDDVRWKPDYVVVAVGENVANLENVQEESEWSAMLVRIGEIFRKANPDVKLVYRTPFWPNGAKRRATMAAASRIGAYLADLGERGGEADMQACNRGFSHAGVSHHPGDAGMRMIADTVLDTLFAAEIALPDPAYGKDAVVERRMDGGIRVKARVCGSYIVKGGILSELAVDCPEPRPNRSVRLRISGPVAAKLVSEIPNGWCARTSGAWTVLEIPVDRAHTSYPDEAVLPAPHDVPELLVSEEGRRIATREEWERIRRPEILKFFRDRVYGRRPCERPSLLRFEPIAEDRVMMDGAAVRKRVRIVYGGDYGTNSFSATAFIPMVRKKPVSSFLLICNRDPKKNIDPDRREKSGFWPAEEIVRRGFAAIAFYNGDVAPDYVHGNTVGAFTAFEDVTRRYRDQSAWGLISCWGWGASRVLDWVETEPTLDARRVAVVGHSRGGKTALVAAAMDERFAMACVNDSGCCGMKLNHIELPASERPLHTIRNRQNWYCLGFTEFANREREMPYDMHALAALIAPRRLCVASASDDSEAGPVGEFWSARLASPAWELYGKRGLVSSDAFPAAGHPLQEGEISYHVRRGGHDLTAYDWHVYMDFFEHE